MKTISRYIMTLALLITAATGAWAQEETLLTTINASSDFTSGSKTFDNKATVTFSGTVNYDSDDGWNFYDSAADPITMTITAAEGYTITSVKLTIGDATLTDNEAPFVATLYGQSYYPKTTISDQASGIWGGVNKIEVYGYETPASGPEVTLNDDKTEASFTMPAFDATAEYELVRDMSIQMTATMGDGTDGVRYRVKKAQQGEGYEPADLSMTQVLALVAVNDGIEQKALTLDQDYFCRIYKLDEQTLQPEGDGVTLSEFDFAPGLYALKAFAMDDSDYAGETTLSNTFKLFQGYELTVAPGDYATYYREDDALYVEDENVKLYTITAVSGTTATATELTVAPAGTPILVKNNSTDPEKTTVLLIPTTTDDDVNFYAGFRGTLEATTIAASDAATDRYALNGQQFVWVKNALPIAANKAWLEVRTGANADRARAINIVFGEATGVSEVIEANGVTDDTFYDLNGRKVAVPTKKGIYIKNGKKVVVK